MSTFDGVINELATGLGKADAELAQWVVTVENCDQSLSGSTTVPPGMQAESCETSECIILCLMATMVNTRNITK